MQFAKSNLISVILVTACLALTACSFMRGGRVRKESQSQRKTLVRCETSHSARENVAIGNQILALDVSDYKYYEEFEARLDVANFCFSRALALSPDNYGATLSMGVASLTAAKATLYSRKIYDIFRRKHYTNLAEEHLDRAKSLLGHAYMLRSGQIEALYYLAEVAVLEREFEIASRYLSHMKKAKHRSREIATLVSEIRDLQAEKFLARFLAEYRATRNPTLSLPTLRSQQVSGGKKFRVGILSFGDSPSGLALPALLLTELQETGRFQIFEGGGIRVGGQDHAPLTEATARDFVDGYLSGTITKLSPNELCFGVRLSNALSHHVLYARSVCSPVEARSAEILVPKKEKLVALALDVARAVKEIQASTITGVDDAMVYIDVGAESGVIPGMVGYVLGTGSSVKDESITESVVEYTGVEKATNTGSGDNEFVVGGVYIISVGESSSAGIFYREGVSVEERNVPYAIPGDTVHFK